MTRLVPLEKSGSPRSFSCPSLLHPSFSEHTHDPATTRAIDRRQDQRRQRPRAPEEHHLIRRPPARASETVPPQATTVLVPCFGFVLHRARSSFPNSLFSRRLEVPAAARRLRLLSSRPPTTHTTL